MKFTMRDKVCQLIGKYQYLEDYYKAKAAIYTGFIIRPAEPVQADMCGQFLADLNKLLEEDEVNGHEARRPYHGADHSVPEAPAAAQAAESAAKEARNNG